ncbi:carboxypeptidase O [Trichinella spiralis]|uniref:carboxypeptidase O n=1 Tax=Trichinella spiralis TaxID=6334 RepID=UPI0001EFEC08|nr:carboxypeptidase O [Trichinella spiralis]
MDFWTPLTDLDNYDKPIIAFVPPSSVNLLIESLEKSKISYSNITDVFRKHFNNHVQMLKDKKHKMKTSKILSTFALNEYHTLAEIHWYMQALSRKHPQIVKLINIGYSSEGRPLLAVKILHFIKQVGRKFAKNSIWIDAGMHAREWIAPATAVYLLHELAENYENTKEIQFILNKYSFYILPVVNPDGYDYSWKSERFWRKSRSKHNCTFWSCCVGVDLDSIDLRGHPCRPDYPGPFPFSESETRAVSKFLSENQQRILLAISLHSFGKLLTVPYSFKSDEVENSNFQTYTARHFLQATAFKNEFYTFTQAYNNYTEVIVATVQVEVSYCRLLSVCTVQPLLAYCIVTLLIGFPLIVNRSSAVNRFLTVADRSLHPMVEYWTSRFCQLIFFCLFVIGNIHALNGVYDLDLKMPGKMPSKIIMLINGKNLSLLHASGFLFIDF